MLPLLLLLLPLLWLLFPLSQLLLLLLVSLPFVLLPLLPLPLLPLPRSLLLLFLGRRKLNFWLTVGGVVKSGGFQDRTKVSVQDGTTLFPKIGPEGP